MESNNPGWHGSPRPSGNVLLEKDQNQKGLNEKMHRQSVISIHNYFKSPIKIF